LQQESVPSQQKEAPGPSDTDVLAQYKDGPMAELAQKMAKDSSPQAAAPQPEPEPEPIPEPEPLPDSMNQAASFAGEEAESESAQNRKKGARRGMPASAIVIIIAVCSIAIGITALLLAGKSDAVDKKEPGKPEQRSLSARSDDLEKAVGSLGEDLPRSEKPEHAHKEKEPRPSSSQPPASSLKPQASSLKPPASSPKPQASSPKPQASSPKPQASSPKPAVKASEISADFFSRSYRFRDSEYHGSITFEASGQAGGTYMQSVSPMGSSKVFNVSGTFTFGSNLIRFRPAGAGKTVEWKLKTLDAQTGNARFYDPQKGDQAGSYIDLTIE
jgi:hypothetical protein